MLLELLSNKQNTRGLARDRCSLSNTFFPLRRRRRIRVINALDEREERERDVEGTRLPARQKVRIHRFRSSSSRSSKA